ncbi:hypothetical protein Mapa_014261 [Marchantia paleacea]|nr:hypothetical protein Mapa_014261 [Marchantia paleacea]
MNEPQGPREILDSSNCEQGWVTLGDSCLMVVLRTKVHHSGPASASRSTGMIAAECVEIQLRNLDYHREYLALYLTQSTGPRQRSVRVQAEPDSKRVQNLYVSRSRTMPTVLISSLPTQPAASQSSPPRSHQPYQGSVYRCNERRWKFLFG